MTLMMYDQTAFSSSLPTYSWRNSAGLAYGSLPHHPCHWVPFLFHVHLRGSLEGTAEDVAAAHVIAVAVGDDDVALQPTAVAVVADAVLQLHWHSAGQPCVLSSSTASAGAVS